jgi:hypothetical protein
LARQLRAIRRHCPGLFDHIVGGYEHGVRHDQRERLGGLAIDDHHELGWLHDGQVGGLLAFQNPGDIGVCLAIRVDVIWSVGDQCTVNCSLITGTLP